MLAWFSIGVGFLLPVSAGRLQHERTVGSNLGFLNIFETN